MTLIADPIKSGNIKKRRGGLRLRTRTKKERTTHKHSKAAQHISAGAIFLDGTVSIKIHCTGPPKRV